MILASGVRIPVERPATAAAPVANAPAGADRPRGQTRAVRPEHAYALKPEDLKRFEDFVRKAGRSSVSIPRRHTRSGSSAYRSRT